MVMKNMRWNLVFAFALLSLLGISTLPALGQSSPLDVKCVDSGGNPVSGVKVTASMLTAAKQPKDKKTDSKGVADFGKSDDGIYRIVGRKEGFAPVFADYVQLKGGERQSVTLTMQPGDPLQKLYFEDQTVASQMTDVFQQGFESLKAGKFGDAENKFKAALEVNPFFAQAQFYLATAYLSEQKWDPGEAALNKAVSIASVLAAMPSKDPAWTNLYSEIKKQGETQLAKMPALRAEDAGRKAFAQKNYEAAVTSFQEAIKIEPNDGGLYSNLAVSLANLHKFDEADEAIGKAIQLLPTDKSLPETRTKITDMRHMAQLAQANTILSEGDGLYKSQDYAGALKKYEAALPLVTGPKQAIIHAALARCYAGLNNPEKVVAAYRKAMEVAPEDQSYRNSLANYFLKEKRYEDALNLYADQGATGQADQTLFNLGMSLSKQGNTEVAELAFEKAITANPSNAEAYYELGMMLYYDKKKDARAKELLEKYVQLGKSADHLSNTNNVLVVLKRRMTAK
jgi:tetratricopeptide (TPR) repeat protein